MIIRQMYEDCYFKQVVALKKGVAVLKAPLLSFDEMPVFAKPRTLHARLTSICVCITITSYNASYADR